MPPVQQAQYLHQTHQYTEALTAEFHSAPMYRLNSVNKLKKYVKINTALECLHTDSGSGRCLGCLTGGNNSW